LNLKESEIIIGTKSEPSTGVDNNSTAIGEVATAVGSGDSVKIHRPTRGYNRRESKMSQLTAVSGPLGPLGSDILSKVEAGLASTSSSVDLMELDDRSHLHRGHAGVRNSLTEETHFHLRVVSDRFEGVTRVKRHQMVMKWLDEEFSQKGLHALELALKTPTENLEAVARAAKE